MERTIQKTGASISKVDLDARQAYVVGKPPRIPPLKPDELGQDATENMNKLRTAISTPTKKEVSAYVAIMMRHPDLYQKHMAVALQLFNGTLTLRDRELVIIRTAWLCQAPFEFGEHVSLGKRLGGLTDEEIDWLILGSAAGGWNEHERAVIRAAEELHESAMISDETWAVLSKEFNDRQLIELPMVVGHYQKVAFIQNSLRVPLTSQNKGLSAR